MNGVTLYSKNKSGKILEWRAESDLTVDPDTGWITLNLYYGQQGGKIQHKVRYTKSGKNIGKANATTIEQQAELDLGYLYRAQLEDKGYFLSIDEYAVRKTAMLAHKYKDKAHKLKLEEDKNTFNSKYFVQPKLNGIRCTATKVSEDTIEFLSRSNTVFTCFEHLEKQLLPLLEVGDMVDGELFNPEMPLEHIASLVNSQSDRYVIDEDFGITLWNITDLQYFIYDGVEKDKESDSAETRQEYLDRLFGRYDVLINPHLVRVVNVDVKTIEEVRTLFSQWIAEGFEGLMLRDATSPYEYDTRSSGLLKYKEMYDEEFKIVDIVENENEPGQPKFIVEVNPDQFCEVCINGAKTSTTQYLTNRIDYLGKYLTVQYQAKTIKGNLSFPRGLMIRAGSVVDGVFVPDE